MFPRRTLVICFACLLSFACASSIFAAGYEGVLELVVTDDQTGAPLAVRMELINSRGRPVKFRSEGTITRPHFSVFDGQTTLKLKKGSYRFSLDAGPEYQTRQGHFTIERHADDSKQITLKRHVDMPAEGWWAGDLDFRVRAEDLPLMMKAAHIHFAPPTAAANVRGKYQKPKDGSHFGNGFLLFQDYRRGGGLQILVRPENEFPTDKISKLKEQESSLGTLTAAAESGADIVALTPYAWDLPLWIAADKLSAINIQHRPTWLESKAPHEGWGRPRDRSVFAGKQGNGFYSESIYHELLNCGVRIPPAAGSGAGFGSGKIPLGSSRVYVDCAEEFSEQEWLEGLRAGRVMVTNGPLLRTKVEGQSPGHVFHIDRDESREFQIALSLSFYERAPVEYLEIVKNGRVEYNIRLSDLAKKQGKLPPLEFNQSGWFLVRAITSSTETYQYATTGPYYVEQNYRPRVSRRSVEYFLAWLKEAAEKFADNEQVLADIEEARPFWRDLLERSNTD